MVTKRIRGPIVVTLVFGQQYTRPSTLTLFRSFYKRPICFERPVCELYGELESARVKIADCRPIECAGIDSDCCSHPSSHSWSNVNQMLSMINPGNEFDICFLIYTTFCITQIGISNQKPICFWEILSLCEFQKLSCEMTDTNRCLEKARDLCFFCEVLALHLRSNYAALAQEFRVCYIS